MDQTRTPFRRLADLVEMHICFVACRACVVSQPVKVNQLIDQPITRPPAQLLMTRRCLWHSVLPRPSLLLPGCRTPTTSSRPPQTECKQTFAHDTRRGKKYRGHRVSLNFATCLEVRSEMFAPNGEGVPVLKRGKGCYCIKTASSYELQSLG